MNVRRLIWSGVVNLIFFTVFIIALILDILVNMIPWVHADFLSVLLPIILIIWAVATAIPVAYEVYMEKMKEVVYEEY